MIIFTNFCRHGRMLNEDIYKTTAKRALDNAASVTRKIMNEHLESTGLSLK